MTSREFLNHLDRFFFAPYSPYPLSIFRILIGLLMLDTVIMHLVDDFFFTMDRTPFCLFRPLQNIGGALMQFSM